MEELIKSNQQKLRNIIENVVGDVKSTAELRCNWAQF